MPLHLPSLMPLPAITSTMATMPNLDPMSWPCSPPLCKTPPQTLRVKPSANGHAIATQWTVGICLRPTHIHTKGLGPPPPTPFVPVPLSSRRPCVSSVSTGPIQTEESGVARGRSAMESQLSAPEASSVTSLTAWGSPSVSTSSSLRLRPTLQFLTPHRLQKLFLPRLSSASPLPQSDALDTLAALTPLQYDK